MKARAIAALAALGAGAGALVVVLAREEAGTVETDASYTPDLARGEAIYAEACASCHGVSLEGEPNWRERGPDGLLPAPPHDVTGHTWHHPDRVLFDITKYGAAAVVGGDYESRMPGFADAYSDAEIRDVLAWIKSQWPEAAREAQAAATAQDKAAQ